LDDTPLSVLLAALFFLIVLSAFFSGSETGLMTINRYRLRHMADKKHPGAMRAQQLLQRQDRLIGLILLGNNVVNVFASILMTLIALRLYNDAGFIFAAGIVLTIIILLFAEVTPKTLAALHPERIAYPAAYVYTPLLKLVYPIVWIINVFANGLLRMLGVSAEESSGHALTQEELRTVVTEAGALIPERHASMLLNLIDLEKVTVEDIMVPRNDVTGIDINDDWDSITRSLSGSQYTRMPLYRESIDNVIGVLHMRDVLPHLYHGELDHDSLQRIARDAYFIPVNTSLNRQLLNFQRKHRRLGFAVDEYGDIQGLVTLEDILEEIVGEFTSDPWDRFEDIQAEKDGTWLVDGSVNIRNLNSALEMDLSIDGPKTLNGYITESLEMIPENNTSLLIDGHPVDILQVKENMVKTVRIHPRLQREDDDDTGSSE
jgi:Mg2+/Co2+ transporter CorB